MELSQPNPPHLDGRPWARTTLWVGVVLIVMVAALLGLKACLDTPGRIMRQTSDALATVAAAFHRGAVSNSFVSYATTLTNNLHLQVTTLNEMEIFTHEENPSTIFGYIPLPDVVVEARAPVQYTYYLDLNGEWRFVLQEHTVRVYAPPLRFNKPAVDASAITYEVKRGMMKTDEALANLKRSISSLVVLRARDNIGLIRETARRQTAEFVQSWLLRTFADGREFSVHVSFAGEADPLHRTPDGLPLR